MSENNVDPYGILADLPLKDEAKAKILARFGEDHGIAGIRELRDSLGMGLAEAKIYWDIYQNKSGKNTTRHLTHGNTAVNVYNHPQHPDDIVIELTGPGMLSVIPEAGNRIRIRRG